MSLQKYFGRLRHIDLLIQKRSTGNIDSLAKKISLSRAGTHKFLQEMKEEGFPIAYNKKDKTYYYTRAGKMTDALFKDILSQWRCSLNLGIQRYHSYKPPSGLRPTATHTKIHNLHILV